MLELAKKNEYTKIYELMKISFPPDELPTLSYMEKLADEPRYSLFSLTENNKVIGLISVWDIDYFAFIEHFAVSPDCRNCGLGTKILSETLSKIGKLTCLEVEKPTDDIKIRRVRFYERNGFMLNEYDYLQPAYSKNKKPLSLFVMSLEKKLSEEEFEKIKDKVYKTVYKNLI